MISTKKFIVDGNTKSFLSEFIIKSIQHLRVYIYEYNPSCLTSLSNGVDICDTINENGFYIRQFDAPKVEDLVTIDKYDLIDNRISFYNDYIPPEGLTLWIEVATNADEFSEILATPAAIRAETAADNAEASAVRAENSAKSIVSLEEQVSKNTTDISLNDEGINYNYNMINKNSNDIANNKNHIQYLSDSMMEMESLLLQSKTISVLDFGAIGDGIEDDTIAIQETIQSLININENGGIVYFPAGKYLISKLILPSNVILKGESQDSTILIQKIGTNDDIIVSKDYDISDIKSSGIIDISIDGQYFETGWNFPDGHYGNTSGCGLKLRGYGLKIDVQLNNIAGIGALFEEPHNQENSSDYHMLSTVSIVGRDFGKEGLIIKGPNDWLLEKCFIGRAGILKRPEAETQKAISDYYFGQAVDGVVLDGANIEIGTLHVYENWSGTGFKTRNNVRLTNGGVIISESNRAQVYLSNGTYGSASIDIRNLSLLHPNWTGVIPTYTAPNSEFDGITIDADDIDLDITCKRTITDITRVVGTTSVVNNGSATINLVYSNSTAPVGDIEEGSFYTGDAIRIVGDSAVINAKIKNCYGSSINILGGSNKCKASIVNCIGTAAVTRNSLSNSKLGNIMEFSFKDCPVGFNSIGTPMAERLDITYEYGNGGVPYIGDAPDLYRQQTWNINGSISNVRNGMFSTNNIITRGLNYLGTELSTLLDNKEDSLGNPTNDGDVLSSTISGVRSWVTPGGSSVDLTNLTTNIVPTNDNALDIGLKGSKEFRNIWARSIGSKYYSFNIISGVGSGIRILDRLSFQMANFNRYSIIFKTGTSGYEFGIDGKTTPLKINHIEMSYRGFFKQGELATGLKTKIISGFTPVNEGETVLESHNLIGDKIVSISCVVRDTTNCGVIPNTTIGNYEYSLKYDDTNVIITTVVGNSSFVLNKPFDVLITYKE